MAEAGFRCCATGFESGDALLLKNMWKGQSVEQAKRFVDSARELGILVHGCFMVGFPGETRETMQKTLALALHLRPDSAQFYPVMPFPGTTYFQWAQEHGYLATERFADWLDGEGGHRCVLNLPGLTPEEIDRFCASALRHFYFRPSYLWHKARQAFARPREGIRSLKSVVYSLGYLAFRNPQRRRPLAVAPVAVPSDWYSRHGMPKGRMFKQWTEIRQFGTAHEAPATPDFGELARRVPDI
jgi:anaerobic magnesium-protoporphyrin IX monomethyl ester cyclase